MTTLAAYEKRFGIAGSVTFLSGPGNLPCVDIKNSAAAARISLYAAHVLSFTPAGKSDVLWVSAESMFNPGDAIRGGIPICWPWFGAAKVSGLPAHGFARLCEWSLDSVKVLSSTETELMLSLSDNEKSRSIWPHAFKLNYRIVVGASLSCTLTTHNTGKDTLTIHSALHSYFSVQADQAQIRGLEGCMFTTDATADKRFSETKPIRYNGEIDRAYHQTAATCYIDDELAKRSIVIAKKNSNSTVVWNPGPNVAKKKPDFGDEEYKDMFCVETCTIAEDAQIITPGSSKDYSVIISLG